MTNITQQNLTQPPKQPSSSSVSPKEETIKNVETVLKKVGIEKVIKKIVPPEEIQEVKVEYVAKLETKPEITTKIPITAEIAQKIESEITKEIKKPAKVKLIPVKAKVIVELIKIKTKTGKEEYFTKIEKKVNASKVIEVVPKTLAKTADDVIWVEGTILRVIEKDPVFEVKPQNYTIAYLVEGNKTKEATETLTFTYEYENVENKTVSTKQNVTKANVTTKKKETEKTNWLPIAGGIIVLTAIAGGVYFLLRRKK